MAAGGAVRGAATLSSKTSNMTDPFRLIRDQKEKRRGAPSVRAFSIHPNCLRFEKMSTLESYVLHLFLQLDSQFVANLGFY